MNVANETQNSLERWAALDGRCSVTFTSGCHLDKVDESGMVNAGQSEIVQAEFATLAPIWVLVIK
jgi:hypothetical protein